MADQIRRVRAAAITGLGQLLGLVGSALIGVLVAGTLPPSARVDAFFGANQIYALSLYLGQAVRITAPALIVRSGLPPARLRDATIVLTAVMVAIMVGAAAFGPVLVPPPSRDAFTSDLLYLAPAAALHVTAGGLAARLSVLGSFGYAAMAYAAGSIVSGVLLFTLIDSHGASALAPCLFAGAASVMVIMGIGYARTIGFSWQPATAAPRPATIRTAGGLAAAPVGAPIEITPAVPDAATMHLLEVSPEVAVVGPGPAAASLREPATTGFAVRRIGLGAVPALSLQLLITVVAVAAGHVVPGGTALLSYAFLALFAFTTIAITPMSIVLGPEMAERWDGDLRKLATIIRQATRLAVVVAVPVIALGFLVGRPLAGLLLHALTEDDLDEVFAMLAILSPSLLLTAAATAATVGITTADRLGELAAGLVAVGIGVLIAGVLIVQLNTPLVVVALLACGFAIIASVVTLYVAVGAAAPKLIGVLIAENVPVLVPSMAATALFASVASSSLALGIVLAGAVCLVHLVAVIVLRRDTLDLLLGALRPKAQA